MSVRQYVGARYVPKFYSNSVNPNSANWEANKSYEALTVVTYNNSSYTSKVAVPVSVGNPAQNPTYWALTGNYNSQVEEYRQATQQVQEQANATQNELTNEINTRSNLTDSLQSQVNNKYPSNMKSKGRMIVIGDSYAYGYTPDGHVKGWPILLKEYMNLSNDNFYTASIGGAGFKAIGVDGKSTFLSLLKELNVQNPDTINTIIVAGGFNDAKSPITPEEIGTSMAEFISYCNAHFPNARIFIGFLGWTSDPTITYLRFNDDPYMSLYLTADQYFLSSVGCTFINGSQYLAHNPEWLASDGVHPNATGQVEIAHGIQVAIYGNSTPTLFNSVNTPVISGDSGTCNNVYSCCNGETSTLSIGRYTYLNTLNDTEPKTLDGDHYFQIGVISNSYVYGSHRKSPIVSVNCFMKVDSDQQFTEHSCNIKIDNGKLLIAPKLSSGSGWESKSFSSVIIPAIRFIVNSVGQF